MKFAPWYGIVDAQMAIISDYRIPDAILDLMLNPAHRLFYQGLHHYADELYFSSPSFLVSAGGHYAESAYTVVGEIGDTDAIGKALPTTVMPTGFGLSRENFIRFEGVPQDDLRSNMCVAPGFACGLNPVIPDAMLPGPDCYESTSGPNAPLNKGAVYIEPLHFAWTFINFSGGCGRIGPYGLYAAVYHRDLLDVPSELERGIGGFGFVEVFDTYVNPSVTFDQFVRHVLDTNGGRSYGENGPNVYETISGQVVKFQIAAYSRTDSRILELANGPPIPTESEFTSGSIMESRGSNGFVAITNRYLQTNNQIVLNDRKGYSPVEKTVSVKPFRSDSCLPGFVWRLADPIDHTCVTSAVAQQTASENAQAVSRHAAGSVTCKIGFVPREVDPVDHICVLPSSQAQAQWDNTLAPSRRAIPIQPVSIPRQSRGL